MYSTHYDSPHGLMNKWNYSTAYDIGKLASNCMKIEEIRKVVNTKSYECEAKTFDNKKRGYKWENTNRLLGVEGF
jgi:D-alanyl-D-alanine carboxypeptidase